MLWFKHAALFLVVSALVGCGFTPLYAPSSTGPGAQGFPTIYVAQVEDRVGQQYRNILLDLLNTRGEPLQAAYILRSELSESRETLAVQRTASATRANVRMTVRFDLFKRGHSTPVWTGEAISVASYNVFDSEYATLQALENVRARAVRQLAENVRIRLGIYFHRGDVDPDQTLRP